MNYLALFFTHSGAMKYNRHLKSLNILSEMMPVPRTLSSSCGIAVKFKLDDSIDDFISDDIEKLYEIHNNAYNSVYVCE